MFDDPGKELKKLESQLLKEDAWFERELEEAKALLAEKPKKKAPAQKNPQTSPKPAGSKKPAPKPDTRVRNYANDYGKDVSKLRRNTEELEEEDYGPVKGVKGLIILAVLETLGIVGIVAYWLMYLL